METPKKFLIFSQKKVFLTFRETENLKSFLYFGKWNFTTLRLKNFIHFLKRKLFLYFRKWNPALFSPSKKIHPKKIYCISGNGNPEKIPYVSGNRKPKKLFIFQETKLSYI